MEVSRSSIHVLIWSIFDLILHRSRSKAMGYEGGLVLGRMAQQPSVTSHLELLTVRLTVSMSLSVEVSRGAELNIYLIIVSFSQRRAAGSLSLSRSLDWSCSTDR